MARNELDTLWKVNAKQARFIEEYLLDLNATQAAIRAGYSKKSASAQASDLLSLPKVQARISEKRREMAANAQLSGAQVLAQLARQSFFDPRRLVDAEGNQIPLAELPDDIAMCIQSIEVEKRIESQMVDGELVTVPRITTKLKFSDRTKSVDMLMRHLGLYEKDNKQANPISALFEYIENRKAGVLPVKTLEAEIVDARPGVEDVPRLPRSLDDDEGMEPDQVARLS